MSTSSVSSMPQSPAVTESFESPNSNESKSDDTTYDASIKAKPVLKLKLLSSLALACDRSGISDRAAAHVSSAVLEDIGVITFDDASHVIDKSKIRRERSKVRKHLQDFENQIVEENRIAIFFDGRKDTTLSQVSKGSKKSRANVIEEHITIFKGARELLSWTFVAEIRIC